MYHPEFVAVDTQGRRMDFGQFEEAMIASIRRATRGVTSRVVPQARPHPGPDEAVAWVEQTFVFKAETQVKESVNRKETGRYAETFKRTASGWRVIYSRQLPTNDPGASRLEADGQAGPAWAEHPYQFESLRYGNKRRFPD